PCSNPPAAHRTILLIMGRGKAGLCDLRFAPFSTKNSTQKKANTNGVKCEIFGFNDLLVLCLVEAEMSRVRQEAGQGFVFEACEIMPLQCSCCQWLGPAVLKAPERFTLPRIQMMTALKRRSMTVARMR